MLLTATEYIPSPTGEYVVQVKDWEDDPKGRFGPQFLFTLEIVEGEEKGRDKKAWTPQNLTSKNALGKLFNACGIDFETGDQVDLDDLIGKRCIAVIIAFQRDDGSEGDKVESVKRLKKKAATEQPKVKKQIPADDEDDEDVFADD